ncbi:hypothetical protein E1A91_D08G054700v1 [Gossypium mustelinum]|uniref:Uncharacterized protein n=1 Tax=Gossypium mustelinum TaxID=34275 RepID=A0A5D2TUN2_GOSMU|nr:hypothetical protein E1A91_D08G054700v1 [Gossypium mustelinum]
MYQGRERKKKKRDGAVVHRAQRGYDGTCACASYRHRSLAFLRQPTSPAPPTNGCYSSFRLVNPSFCVFTPQVTRVT